MIRRLALVVVTTALVAALGACGSDSGGSSGGDASGEQLYRENCATCHATDGGGALGPSLKGIADRLPRDEHIKIVLDGKGQMPAWKGNLAPNEVDAVVDYERTLE